MFYILRLKWRLINLSITCIKTIYVPLLWTSASYSLYDFQHTFYVTWNIPRIPQFWNLIACEQLREYCCLYNYRPHICFSKKTRINNSFYSYVKIGIPFTRILFNFPVSVFLIWSLLSHCFFFSTLFRVIFPTISRSCIWQHLLHSTFSPSYLNIFALGLTICHVIVTLLGRAVYCM